MQDYSPAKKNRCTGEAFDGDELLYTTATNETLGPLAMKALYRGYTDGSFSTAVSHPPHLGLLGPLMQAQVLSFLCHVPARMDNTVVLLDGVTALSVIM